MPVQWCAHSLYDSTLNELVAITDKQMYSFAEKNYDVKF